MACGVLVVSFDCPSGPRNVVRDGLDGFLVPAEDVEALADTLGRLMGDPGLRRRMGARALEIRERFSLERVLAEWDGLFEEVGERWVRET